MGREKFVDSSLLDKAILFATEAHKNTERRGKGLPYIVHPMEVVSIVSSMTNDQEILAAAVLHDTVEDTKVTLEDIKKEFGERVAQIVDNESDKVIEGKSDTDSWKERKTYAIERLAKLPIDSKMVALGDKLSNMRTIANDFNEIGDELWNRFHNNDPKEHEWHYRGLANSLKELSNYEAYKEFVRLIDDVFERAGKSAFKYRIEGNKVYISGIFNKENSLLIESKIKEPGFYTFDFTDVIKINFAGIRTLLRMYSKGIKVNIIEASNRVAIMFYRTGVSDRIRVNEKFRDYELKVTEQSGAGYTSITYNLDEDSMLKLYSPMIKKDSINTEKTIASSVMLLGVPTPMSGNLIKIGDQYGLIFERIVGKKSFSRMLEADPDNYDAIAKKFADACLSLHATRCNTHTFRYIGDIYKDLVKSAPVITEEDRKFILDELDSIEVKKTCIHGDLHIGNIVETGDGDILFIDMADFAYGDPRFDLGMSYLVCNIIPERRAQEDYHCSCALLRKFWKSFLKHYLKTEDEDKIQAFVENLYFFIALRMLFIASLKNWESGMLEFYKQHLDLYKKTK